MEEMSIAALAFSCIKWPTNFLKQILLFGVRVFGRRTGQICFVSVQGWPFFKKIKKFGMYKKIIIPKLATTAPAMSRKKAVVRCSNLRASNF